MRIFLEGLGSKTLCFPASLKAFHESPDPISNRIFLKPRSYSRTFNVYCLGIVMLPSPVSPIMY